MLFPKYRQKAPIAHFWKAENEGSGQPRSAGQASATQGIPRCQDSYLGNSVEDEDRGALRGSAALICQGEIICHFID